MMAGTFPDARATNARHETCDEHPQEAVMRTQFGITLVVLLSLAALGCNERPQQRVTREPLFYVPTAAVIQHREVPVPGVASQVLPESDSYAYIPRDE